MSALLTDDPGKGVAGLLSVLRDALRPSVILLNLLVSAFSGVREVDIF